MGKRRRRKRSRKPPADAQIIFSGAECELREGLVFLEVASGGFRQNGFMPLSLGVRLHRLLGIVISQARAGSVTELASRSAMVAGPGSA